MNDPSKRIDVNISSLLSLKAELLRKQDEVNKAKEKQKTEPFIPKKGPSSSASTKSDKTEHEDSNKNYEEYEDSELMNKSKKVLEAKAKFYDRMAKSGGKLNSDDNCLVLFNQKQQDNKFGATSDISSSDISSDEDFGDKYDSKNPDEEWIEYTDCLGRTRKCLKKDLEFFKKKDTKLAENIQPRIELNQNAPMWMIDTKGSNSNDKTESRDDMSEMTSVMSKHDQMKLNWEKKEEENVYKENVHYQDVLFDEARQHGVGYYAFSTDEEMRAKQRKALDEMRERTLQEQKEKEAQRDLREKIIAERVKAAKNRQRARLGLPPIEDEPEPEKELFNTKEEEKRKKREEKERRKKEKEENRKEEERKRHIRPWDRNKDGVPPTTAHSDSSSEDEWTYKPQKEPMSQEQWNECKREERNQEFAPIPEEEDEQQKQQQLSFRRSFRSQQPVQMPACMNEAPVNESLYFTTKKSSTKRQFVRRNYSGTDNIKESGAPIRNELEEDYEEVEKLTKRSKGAEIPPPPTFEYYGPSGSSSKSHKAQSANLEQSIEAGLKFLRDQSDKGVLSTKSSWTAKSDY